jgi:hypothetical protein
MSSISQKIVGKLLWMVFMTFLKKFLNFREQLPFKEAAVNALNLLSSHLFRPIFVNFFYENVTSYLIV